MLMAALHAEHQEQTEELSKSPDSTQSSSPVLSVNEQRTVLQRLTTSIQTALFQAKREYRALVDAFASIVVDLLSYSDNSVRLTLIRAHDEHLQTMCEFFGKQRSQLL